MQTIVLSDFVGDQLSVHDRKREAWNEAMGEFHRKENAGLIRRGKLRSARTKEAFDGHHYVLGCFWYIVGFIFSFCEGLFMSPLGHDNGTEPPSRAVAILRSGSEGEQLVQTKLSALSNDFVLLCGYKNRNGEIDQVLVGPHGIICIEVKHVNGRISCNGDSWWRDKFDKFDNLVEKNVPIRDRGGRGPSLQVNAAAQVLQNFIEKRTGIKHVFRAVVFSHESSVLNDVKSHTVDVVTDLKKFHIPDLIKWMASNCPPIKVDDVVALMRQDHARTMAAQVRPVLRSNRFPGNRA